MSGTLNLFVSSGDFLFFTFTSNAAFEFSGFQILYFSNDTGKNILISAKHLNFHFESKPYAFYLKSFKCGFYVSKIKTKLE